MSHSTAAILSIGAFIVLLLLLYVMAKKGHSFNRRTLTALVVGLVFGFILQRIGGGPHSELVKCTDGALRLVGSGYLSLLEMLVIPLILTSIIHAVMNMGDLCGKILQRLAVFSVGMLLVMTAIASSIGLGVGLLFHVGVGLQLPHAALLPNHHYTGVVDTLLGMLPTNPIHAMSNENTVAVVVFAVLVAVAGLWLYKLEPKQAQSFKDFVSSAFMITKKLASIVISLTPYGVLALMAQVASTQGWHSILGLADFIAAMYVAMLLVLSMHLLILALQGHLPWQYLRRAYAPLLVAFMTRSSFGTLPVTEETLNTRLKLRQVTSTFVPSMGATLGMNACAGIFPAMLVVMAMTITHQPITLGVVLMVMFVNALASLGISGIPGTAFVAATVSLTTLGLPYAVVGLVQGVDPIIDMGRTATNVNGVMTTAVTVDRLLK